MNATTISLSRAIHEDPEVAWAVVVACLHYKGSCHALTRTLRADKHARTLADGFGKLDPHSPGYEDCLWDWSHVRDSSPEAVTHMADFLLSRYEGAGRSQTLCDALSDTLGRPVRI